MTQLAMERTKLRAAKSNIPISLEYARLDLSDQSSIRNFVEEIKRKNYDIDLLINNAGVMWFPQSVTREGIETHFGVNYIGHFLLTMLMLPLLKESSRILCLGSSTSTYGSFDFGDLNLHKNYNRFLAYSNSKLAISHFTISLSEKLKQSKKKKSVFYIDPGSVNTEITKSMPFILRFLYATVGKYIFKTLYQGACCSVYASIAPELEDQSGLFLFECKKQHNVFRSEGKFNDERERLWIISEHLSNTEYPF